MPNKYEWRMNEMGGHKRIYLNKTLINPEIIHKKSFNGCYIEKQEQRKGVKPHYAIIDNAGTWICEITARQTSAYKTIQLIEKLPITHAQITYREEDNTYIIDLQADLMPLHNYNNQIRRIVIDTETTGLDPQFDEILQLSIIDGYGNTILNNYYKPQHIESWEEAQKTHHITPRMIKNKPPIEQDIELIQSILNRAQEVVIYNAPFDLAFLDELNLLLDMRKIRDTMREYGQKYHQKEYYKLTNAAAECGYKYNAHDSLADCKATLHVQQAVDANIKIIKQTQITNNNKTINKIINAISQITQLFQK